VTTSVPPKTLPKSGARPLFGDGAADRDVDVVADERSGASPGSA